MVLEGRPSGRVGHRRDFDEQPPSRRECSGGGACFSGIGTITARSLDSRTMADDRRRPRPPSGSGRPPVRKPADSARRGSGQSLAKESKERHGQSSDRDRTSSERGRPPAKRKSQGSNRGPKSSDGRPPRGSSSGKAAKGGDRGRSK